ncbi:MULTISPECIES: DHA2 family efflux MFS transporter permease subunit [unclassified Massilia]|uniref:DHA2 family efflux MFS transporter permease subunit n=1 Tax=unclassified Massilia TaxID=2609279 RepID=UPI0009E82063|nr:MULTISPECIES: DHA2 family efflux MFS transporter permease subunit [unclassified Massilia]
MEFDSDTMSATVQPCAPAARKWVLANSILASGMVFIDGTVVNVALPALQRDFGAGVAQAQWVVEAYALLLTALLLLGGSMGDRYGRRRIFALGVAVFGAASVACGLVGGIGQLIWARALQGVGGALLVPGSLALISASFPANIRGRAIGTWSGYSAITAALGPVLGGFLIEHVSWRAAFLINVPLVLSVLFLTFRHVPESRGNASGRLDWPGALLVSVALGCLVYGLIESSTRGWTDPRVLAALVLAPLACAGFVLTEMRHPSPMLPLGVFRARDFSGANLLTLLLYGALGGLMFFLPLNLIQVQGYSATAAGAALAPFILLMFTLSRWSGGLVDRYGARGPLVIGPAIAAAGFALFALPGIGGSYWRSWFPAILLLGFGMTVTVAPLTTTVMNTLEPARAGLASGINNAVSRAAGLLAIALLGLVMRQAFDSALDRRMQALTVSPPLRAQVEAQRGRLAAISLPAAGPASERQAVERAVAEAFVAGFRRVMAVSALLALASSVGAWWMIGGKQS